MKRIVSILWVVLLGVPLQGQDPIKAIATKNDIAFGELQLAIPEFVSTSFPHRPMAESGGMIIYPDEADSVQVKIRKRPAVNLEQVQRLTDQMTGEVYGGRIISSDQVYHVGLDAAVFVHEAIGYCHGDAYESYTLRVFFNANGNLYSLRYRVPAGQQSAWIAIKQEILASLQLR